MAEVQTGTGFIAKKPSKWAPGNSPGDVKRNAGWFGKSNVWYVWDGENWVPSTVKSNSNNFGAAQDEVLGPGWDAGGPQQAGAAGLGFEAGGAEHNAYGYGGVGAGSGYGIDADAYDPRAQQGYSEFAGSVRNLYTPAAEQYSGAISNLENNQWGAPQMEPRSISPLNGTQYQVNPYGERLGLDALYGLEGSGRNADISRTDQGQIAGQWQDWASGNMPSVGQQMQSENAVNAAAAFQTAGNVANQGYQMAAVDANQGYADALAQQQYATMQASRDAGRELTDANAANIQEQASLYAGPGGRGPLALLNAQNNATTQSLGAIQSANRMYSDAADAASAQAAAGQRQISAQEQQQLIQLQATAERAGIEAARAQEAGDFRAAQIASQEQQNAMQQLTELQNTIREGDIAQQAADLDVAQFAQTMDQFIRDGNLANAEMAFEAYGINTDIAIQIAQMNGDWEAANQLLQADVQKFIAQQGFSMTVTQQQQFMQLVELNLSAGMSLEAAKQAVMLAILTGDASLTAARISGEAAMAAARTQANAQILSSSIQGVSSGATAAIDQAK